MSSRVSLNISDDLKDRITTMSERTNMPVNSLAIIALDWLVTNYEEDPKKIFSNVLPPNPTVAYRNPKIQFTYDEALDRLISHGQMGAANALRDYVAEDGSKRGWDGFSRSFEFSNNFPEAADLLS